jgi:hypothetical protein
LDDRFNGGFALADTVARFDFGTATSPVAQGYTRVTHADRFDAAVGYGWQVGSVFSISRSAGTDLTRDVNYTRDATFAVNLANGEYDVIVTLGDTGQPHDQIGVFLEGVSVDSVTTATGTTVARTYRTSVSDAQLTLRLADLGGSDPWVMINGLDVVRVGSGIQSSGWAVGQPSIPARSFAVSAHSNERVMRPLQQDKENDWDLLIAELSTSRQFPLIDAKLKARDIAFAIVAADRRESDEAPELFESLGWDGRSFR